MSYLWKSPTNSIRLCHKALTEQKVGYLYQAGIFPSAIKSPWISSSFLLHLLLSIERMTVLINPYYFINFTSCTYSIYVHARTLSHSVESEIEFFSRLLYDILLYSSFIETIHLVSIGALKQRNKGWIAIKKRSECRMQHKIYRF